METIEIKLLNESAILPKRENDTDSGLDLYSNETVTIEPNSTKVVSTGVAINLDKGFEAQVRLRSGLTSKTKIRVQLGTIDKTYQNELGVIVDNIGNEPITIEKGKKFAQLVVAPVVYPKPKVVKEFSNKTERGGFGSTGE
ncbi:dUTPase [Staphylococcus phage PG-2021_27]